MIWQAVVGAFVGALALLRALVMWPRGVATVSEEPLAKGACVRVIFPEYPDVEVYGIVTDSADLPARHRRVTIPAVVLTMRFPTANLRIVDEEN